MNDNVIKFRKKEVPKPPRQTPPGVRKALVILGVIAAFLAAFAYFYLTGDQSGLTNGAP